MNNEANNEIRDDEVLRPRTAYNFFYRYQRDMILKSKSLSAQNDKIIELPVLEIDLCNRPKRKRVHRKTHGLVSLQQLTKTVAKRWRELDKSSRDKFIALAEQDKIRYRNEVRARKAIRETFHPCANQMQNKSNDNYLPLQVTYPIQAKQGSEFVQNGHSPQSLNHLSNNENVFTEMYAHTPISPLRLTKNAELAYEYPNIEKPYHQNLQHQNEYEGKEPSHCMSSSSNSFRGSNFTRNFQCPASLNHQEDDEHLIKKTSVPKYHTTSQSQQAKVEAILNNAIDKSIF